MTIKTLKPQDIILPIFKKPEAYAIQALDRGDATAEQQKMALSWIVKRACAWDDVSPDMDNERLSAVFEGRRLAGKYILDILHLNITIIKDIP